MAPVPEGAYGVNCKPLERGAAVRGGKYYGAWWAAKDDGKETLLRTSYISREACLEICNVQRSDETGGICAFKGVTSGYCYFNAGATYNNWWGRSGRYDSTRWASRCEKTSQE